MTIIGLHTLIAPFEWSQKLMQQKLISFKCMTVNSLLRYHTSFAKSPKQGLSRPKPTYLCEDFFQVLEKVKNGEQ